MYVLFGDCLLCSRIIHWKNSSSSKSMPFRILLNGKVVGQFEIVHFLVLIGDLLLWQWCKWVGHRQRQPELPVCSLQPKGHQVTQLSWDTLRQTCEKAIFLNFGGKLDEIQPKKVPKVKKLAFGFTSSQIVVLSCFIFNFYHWSFLNLYWILDIIWTDVVTLSFRFWFVNLTRAVKFCV